MLSNGASICNNRSNAFILPRASWEKLRYDVFIELERWGSSKADSTRNHIKDIGTGGSTSPKIMRASYLIGPLLGNSDWLPAPGAWRRPSPGHCYGGGAMGAITAIHPLYRSCISGRIQGLFEIGVSIAKASSVHFILTWVVASAAKQSKFLWKSFSKELSKVSQWN